MRRKSNKNGRMSCHEVRDILPLWLDRETDQVEFEVVARHLEECDECETLCRELKRMDSLVEANVRQLTVGDGFTASVMRSVRETAIEGIEKPAAAGFGDLLAALFRPFARRPLQLAMSAALFLLVAGAGVWFSLDLSFDGSSRPVPGMLSGERVFTQGLRLSMLNGQARIMNETGGSWQEMSGETNLTAGDRVVTERGAAVRLMNSAGTVIAFTGSASFSILENSVRMSEGRALYNVTHLEDTFSVNVPGGTVTVLGTVFSVTVSPNRSSSVILWEGKVRVSHTGGENRILVPNEKALLDEDKLMLGTKPVGGRDRQAWQKLLAEIARNRVAGVDTGGVITGTDSYEPGRTAEIDERDDKSSIDGSVKRDGAIRGRRINPDILSGESGTIDRIFDAGGSDKTKNGRGR